MCVGGESEEPVVEGGVSGCKGWCVPVPYVGECGDVAELPQGGDSVICGLGVEWLVGLHPRR